jgi:hypothetical protein
MTQFLKGLTIFFTPHLAVKTSQLQNQGFFKFFFASFVVDFVPVIRGLNWKLVQKKAYSEPEKRHNHLNKKIQ